MHGALHSNVENALWRECYKNVYTFECFSWTQRRHYKLRLCKISIAFPRFRGFLKNAKYQFCFYQLITVTIFKARRLNQRFGYTCCVKKSDNSPRARPATTLECPWKSYRKKSNNIKKIFRPLGTSTLMVEYANPIPRPLRTQNVKINMPKVLSTWQ